MYSRARIIILSHCTFQQLFETPGKLEGVENTLDKLNLNIPCQNIGSFMSQEDPLRLFNSCYKF